jgi:TolB-like protein/DNA-binding winged helix-turn-helix (wHTH) protein/nucleotide-binding universal stress UspA family protein
MDDVTASPAPAAADATLFRVDDLIVDLGRRRVMRASVDLKLPGLSFDLFVVLVRAAPNIVTVRRLMDLVWPDAVVSPETISQRVKLLRSALSDDVKSPRYVGGVRNRGYRIVAAVTELSAEAPSPDVPSAAAVPLNGIGWGIASLLLAIVIVFVLRGSANPEAGRVTGNAKQISSLELPARSVAVLPFETLGPNSQNDGYLASGLSDSVLHALAADPQITVIARRSSYALKGENSDVREIGRRLNARYLLEGSLQPVGPLLRVRTALVDAMSAQNIWSLNFDRPLDNLPAAQDEIAARVAQILAVTLNASADERRKTSTTSNPDAYLEYLLARELAASYRLGDLQRAVSHYARALEVDPSFSAALSGLASAKYQMLAFRASNTTERDWTDTQIEVRQELQKALALDNRNADAWQALAAVEDDPDRAEAYDRRAVAIEPSSARAQYALSKAVLLQAYRSAPARIDEVIDLVQRAMRLDPLEPRYPTALAQIYQFQRTTEIGKAEPLFARALELDPNYFPALYSLGALRFCCQNRIADGITLAEQALRLDPSSTAVRSLLVHMYLDVGDPAAAEQLLADGTQNQSAWVAIYAYRHMWGKAAAIMYDDAARANLPIPPDARYGRFAMLMSATDSISRGHAQQLFEKEARIRWQNDGTPTTAIPLNSEMDLEIGLGELMMRGGDEVRARRVLEMALSATDLAAVKYQRGTMWFTLQRARALALLGRTDQALNELSAFTRSGWAPDAWLLDVDTAFDGLRGDERFKRIIEERHANALRERAEVDALRSQKVIPQDLRWR